MSHCHHQNPQDDANAAIAEAETHRQKLRKVAWYQRFVILSLLLNIFGNLAGVGAVKAAQNSHFLIMGGAVMVSLTTFVFQVIVIFLLARQLTNSVEAVAYVILLFFPCLGLIGLLVPNQNNDPLES